MPKVFMFAPTGNSYEVLQAQGCEVDLGKPEWHDPGRDYEAEIASMARGRMLSPARRCAAHRYRER